MRIIPQTLLAPMVSNVLLMTVFVVAFPGRSGGNSLEFIRFLIPGLIMMGILNNATANSSSSMMTSKVNGSITDVLMPPLSSAELAIGFIGGAITRGVLGSIFHIFRFVCIFHIYYSSRAVGCALFWPVGSGLYVYGGIYCPEYGRKNLTSLPWSTNLLSCLSACFPVHFITSVS